MISKINLCSISVRMIWLSLVSLIFLSKRRVSAKNSSALIQTNSSATKDAVDGISSHTKEEMMMNSSFENKRKLDIFQVSPTAFEEQEFLRSTIKTLPSMSSKSASSSIASIKIQFKNVDDSVLMDIFYTIENGPKNCKDCLITIHRAKTCSSPKIGKRRFLKSKNVVSNPWRKKAGAIIVTGENGKGQGVLEAIGNGYSVDKNANHAFVLYDGYKLRHRDKNKRAKLIMCGVLRKVTNA